MIDRAANVYAQSEVPGSLDHLIDELHDKFHRLAPGVDLLRSDIYWQLMPTVTDVKDLGGR